MNAESTGRDKFDDGQELFGSTEWGRGAPPRIQDDAGYIFADGHTWWAEMYAGSSVVHDKEVSYA